MPVRVWTARRRWLGNLLPLALATPLAIKGIRDLMVGGEPLGPGLVWIAGAVGVAWVGMGVFGYFENGRMRRALEAMLRSRGEALPDDRWFCGFASPRFGGLVDAHEDVGFVFVREGRLRFVSETRRIEVERDQVTRVRLLPNAHTWVGLGGWVAVDAVAKGQAVRLLLESRAADTMFANAPRRKRLRTWVEQWWRPTSSERPDGAAESVRPPRDRGPL